MYRQLGRILRSPLCTKCACGWLLVTLLLYSLRQRSWESSGADIDSRHSLLLFTEEENQLIQTVLDEMRSKAVLPLERKNKALASLSSVVQSQLTRLQGPSANCSGPTLLCGHHQDCGFACQIHHRMTCVAISYMTGLPLIHDEVTGWSFTKDWNAAFLNVGTTSKQRQCFLCGLEILPNPLENGFAVPAQIGQLIDMIHEEGFLFWSGQFARFTLRLTESQSQLLEVAKRSIGLSKRVHPTFGLHVRRTDKIKENRNSRHPIEEYFQEIDVFIKRSLPDILRNQITFVASDDQGVLAEARTGFPSRKIVGFSASPTLRSKAERVDYLDDIIRDTLILAESEFIVCGFSSNICRLVLELISCFHSNPYHRVKSLDGEYEYRIYGLVVKGNVRNI